MTFHVYPDPQTAPRTVAPGATEAISINQLTGTAVPAGSYTKMMFIRVAANGGGSTPTLFLKAGNGAPVEAKSLPTGVLRGPDPTADYVGDVKLLGDANNVQRLRMGFIDADAVESWELSVRNNGAAAIQVTAVVAESEAETAQPWISVGGGLLAYHALVNETVPQRLTVANKGTGPLNFTAPGPTLPSGFTITSTLPLSIPPTSSAQLEITFTSPASPPPPLGASSASALLTADPADTTVGTSPEHNQQVTLSTTTQRLEVVLLLDDSGSMAWDALGQDPANKAGSRWGELTSAVNQFLDMLAHFGEKRGRFGIARFPAGDELNPATFDIVPMTDIPGAMSAAQNAVTAITPAGGTPMGDGFDRVLSPATSYFGTDQLSRTVDRRWLILLSDGAHNSGTHNPNEFIGSPGTAPPGASLADLKVHLFAVAYGIDGHSDVDHVLMKTLATGSLGGGKVRNVDEEGTTAAELAVALRDALKAGLTPTAAPRDPQGSYPGQGEVRHEALLTPYDGKVAFVVSWNTSEAGRLSLALLTPAGEEVSADFTPPGVEMRLGDRSHMYLVDQDFLRGRHGTWTLTITGSGPEDYVYDVLTETSLRLSIELDRPTYYAGEPITVSARLTAAGGPVLGASVTLGIDSPATALANWLATVQIPQDTLNRAAELLSGKDVTPILVKQYGAMLAELPFPGGRFTNDVPMTNVDGTGVYQATLAGNTVPGNYAFTVTALGLSDGGAFRREGAVQTTVLVRPNPKFSHVEVQYGRRGKAMVTLIPRDEYGNVLLVDPQTATWLEPLGHGDFGELDSNLDGTYTCPASYDPDAVDGIDVGFQYGEDAVVAPSRFPLPEQLTFPDQVLSFTPGRMIDKERVPRVDDVLGSVIDKDCDTALALGAGGSVTVGFKSQVVLAGDGGPDVTVFVRRDGDLRAYRLEALDEGRDTWMTVGESIGITQPFSLAATGLAATPALRVTDLSGRARDADDRLLRDPGVNVRGLGVARTDGTRG
ncbi:VWA domain-containing protein [Streptomyces sp. NPDC002935]|uniref:vWA domain-containing protein n=1 Tax=Streptomyces sp. NPDC002935 TaxID=3154545 RepID=UPI0033B1E5DA